MLGPFGEVAESLAQLGERLRAPDRDGGDELVRRAV